MAPQDGSFGSEPPFTPPDGFSPYETSWNQEFVAGWLDGFRASRIAMHNVTRLELRRYGLFLDVKSGGVSEIPSDVPLGDPLPEPDKDNPNDHPAYEEGWEAGFQEGHRAVLRCLRQELAERGLFVTESGMVTTLDVASELVDYCRHLADDPPGEELSDEKIHAFIDGVEASAQAPRTRPSVAESDEGEDPARAATVAEPEAGRRSWLRRLGGVWTMIRKEVDRRTAIIAMGSVLVTASAGWLAIRRGLLPTGVQAQEAEIPLSSEYSAPTTWNALPDAARDKYLAWDQVAWQMEEAGTIESLKNVIAGIMEAPGSDQLKSELAFFIKSSQRFSFVPALLPGINPSVSNATTRRTLLGVLHQAFVVTPGAHIPSDLGAGIVAYSQSGLETDPGAILLLNSLVAAWQNQQNL